MFHKPITAAWSVPTSHAHMVTVNTFPDAILAALIIKKVRSKDGCPRFLHEGLVKSTDSQRPCMMEHRGGGRQSQHVVHQLQPEGMPYHAAHEGVPKKIPTLYQSLGGLIKIQLISICEKRLWIQGEYKVQIRINSTMAIKHEVASDIHLFDIPIQVAPTIVITGEANTDQFIQIFICPKPIVPFWEKLVN